MQQIKSSLDAGITFYTKDGDKRIQESVPVTAANPVHLRLSREELNSRAIKEAQRLYPNIKFHFNRPIEHVDLARQAVQVAMPDLGRHVEVNTFAIKALRV